VRTLWRRPLEFFPTRDQSPGERLNSMVRLTLYCSLALVAYSRKPRYLVLGILIIVLASVAFATRPVAPGRFVPVGSPLVDAVAAAATSTATPSGGPKEAMRGEGAQACTWSTPNNP
jgi:hypothetical protein